VLQKEICFVGNHFVFCKEMLQRMHLEDHFNTNLTQLRKLVSHTLCQRNDFEEGIFQITEKFLKRGKNICGIFFCLHGPRSMKLTAVWETEKNSIRFYDSAGEKFKTLSLANST
jgi:histidinol phosphatase-like enzyme